MKIYKEGDLVTLSKKVIQFRLDKKVGPREWMMTIIVNGKPGLSGTIAFHEDDFRKVDDDDREFRLVDY